MFRRWLLGWALGAVACTGPEFDTTRVPPERGTLGEEIYKLFAQDFERDSPRQAQGFALEKSDFIYGIDHLFPPEELEYTQDFMVKLLPLQDDGTLPATTQRLAGVFDRLAADEGALLSLAALAQRRGYVDKKHEEALIRRVARFVQYRPFCKAIIALAEQHDGLTDAGAMSPTESDLLSRLTTQLGKRLSEIELSDDAERDIVLLADLMTTEDPRLGTRPEGEVLTVARDRRGIALVSGAPGQMPAPFVDRQPADGLADVDFIGRFLDTAGKPIDLPPFGEDGSRDPQGRLTDGAGTVYRYVELDRTMLGSMLRTSRDLLAAEVPMKAVRTFDKVLGERTPEGLYDARINPLLDLIHGIGAAGDLIELPDVVEVLRILIADHEPTMTWMMLEMQDQLDIADRYPVALRANNSFFSDFLNWTRKLLAVPGLAEDLLEALRDPAVAGLPNAGITLMSHKKARLTPADVQNGTCFDTEVDFARPDIKDNQSLQQRLFHLIYDTAGVRYVPEFAGIPIGFVFQIDDLAEFFMLSIIGQAEIPGIVSTLTGLSVRPTPEELAVFINEDQQFGNPIGKEGIEVKENDGDTLFAATESGITDGLRPLIQVFYAHGQLDLMFELFEIFHFHWATQNSDYQDQAAGQPRYSHLSGIRRYEPMMIEIFGETKVMDALQQTLEETVLVRTTRGRAAHAVVLQMARQLMAPDVNLRTRDDRREILLGGQRISPLSPFDLVRYALDKLDQILRRESATQREWDAVVDALHDQLLKPERTGPESGQLENRRALPTVTILLDFLRARIEHHLHDPDFSRWVREEMLGLATDALTSPELPMLIDLAYTIDNDPDVSGPLYELRDELMDEDAGFQDLLLTLGDSTLAAKDASLTVGLVRFLGQELDPAKLNLHQSITLAKRSLALDPDEHLLEVVRRGLDQRAGGGLAMYGLFEAAQQAQRVDPLSTEPLEANDWRKISEKVAAYILDQEHGLEKFYSLVKNRTLPEATP